jgi:hypothetical protein
MPSLGLTPIGEITYPKDGRIAFNAIICTKEKGDVLFRCYPTKSSKAALGYGIDRARFEIIALNFLSNRKADVPEPLMFTNGQYSFEDHNWFIFAYIVKKGMTLEIDDLSLNVAKQAGALLNKIILIASKYTPIGNEPTGDIEYIKMILSNFIERRPDLKKQKVFSDMNSQLSDADFLSRLSKTPKGIVHGDYFFENILSLNNEIIGVIDFGDAYYGYLIMDIVIGSMEFSMRKGENWDMDLFEAFISENKRWLNTFEISYKLYNEVLLANCARFTAHICNLEQDALEIENNLNGVVNVNENPYAKRFYFFQKSKVSDEMNRRYDLALKS